MDVAPYVDVYHMPPDVRLHRFLFVRSALQPVLNRYYRSKLYPISE
jgi:hypothetical protein